MRSIAILVGTVLVAGRLMAEGVSKNETEPFLNAKEQDLSGLMGISTGDLAGNNLGDLVNKDKTTRVIVIANTTQAPNSVHFVRLSRLIDRNPKIESIWLKDEKTGERRWNGKHDDEPPFFAVILEDNHGNLTAIAFGRDGVKVVTKDGIGRIMDK